MKKQTLMAVLSAMTVLAVCSCEKEKDVASVGLDSGSVGLVMDKLATRSATAGAVRVNSYRVGTDVGGTELSLEEVVTELDVAVEEGAVTRGVPAYTQNVTSVHGTSFKGVLYGPSGQIAGDDAFTVMDGVTGKDGLKVWRRDFGFNPFDRSDPLYFFLRMPSSPTGVTNLSYSYGSGSISFDYETPATASSQQDILFAARQLNESTYLREAKTNGGASVLFRHALTGVKFAIGNNETLSDDARHPSGKTETFITEVRIKGLKDKGHAVFVPTGVENGTQVDDITEHSSAANFTWTDVSGTSRNTVYTQTFGENDIQDFVQDANDQVGAPASFYQSGGSRNLNKADASLTFWFIPQEITADLEISVTFRIWDGRTLGDEETLDLDLGKRILAQANKDGYTNKLWKAGQLRTFMLKPNVVDVDITDDVVGYTKENVEIRNTGNVKAFIRAHIVANWFGTAGSKDGIAAGYCKPDGTADSDGNRFVKTWKMQTATTDNYGGVFTGLPGSGWVKATDGFYYYTTAVDPGQVTGTPLFVRYNLDTSQHPVPAIYYLEGSYQAFTNVRLVMDIPVQAIEAKEGKTYRQAWADAGVTVTLP